MKGGTMNAVQKLEAAIEKLERLKAESTQPTDGNAWIQGRSSRRYENDTEVYTGPNEDTPGSADIVTFIQPEDADLIVTLHRTIDAQLAILREGVWQASLAFPLEPSQYKCAIALAAAILGEP